MGLLSGILEGTAEEFYSALPSEITNLYGTYDAEGNYTSGIPKITAPSGVKFQPYTVTSGNLGTAFTALDEEGNATGGTTFELSDDQKALQNLLLGGASRYYTDAIGTEGGMAARETDIYNRMRAAQMPEEEDARLAMEERLFNQGRAGLSTSRFGNPEQFEFQMARERSKNDAMLAAMGQAQKEQMQQAELGGMFQQEGYAPLAQLQTALSAGAANASMEDVARRQDAENQLEAQLANIQADLGSRTGLADLYSGLFSSATGVLGSAGSSLLDFVLDKFK
jgi:hypothetical protein